MFAVIKTGGKQYRVTPDDVIRIERVSGEAGDIISFNDILMLDDDGNTAVGAPLVDGAKVIGTLLEQTRGEKIIVFKKKRRKTYLRRNGHRQGLSVVRITDINGPTPKKKAAPKQSKQAQTFLAAAAGGGFRKSPSPKTLKAPKKAAAVRISPPKGNKTKKVKKADKSAMEM